MKNNWLTDWKGAWVAFTTALETTIMVPLRMIFFIFVTNKDPNDFGYRPDWHIWIEVVLWQVFFICGVGYLIRYVFPGSDQWAIYGGTTILWAMLFFFARGIDLFVIDIAEFHRAVFASMFNKNKLIKDDSDRVKMEKTKKLREVDFGVRPKRPWERATIVDMRRQRLVSRTTKGYSSDGIELFADLILPLRPLPGFLCNLVRHEENSIDDIMMSTCQAEVEQFLVKHPQVYTIGHLADLKELFRTVYGGSDKVSRDEKECGVFTDDPKLFNLRRSLKFQESVEAEQIAINTAKAQKALMVDKTVDGKSALDAVLAMEDSATMTITTIRGLENLSYVGGAFLPGIDPRKGGRDKRDRNKNDKKGEQE